MICKVLRESNDIAKSINKFVMSLMFAWKKKKKNFSCNISTFSSNDVVIWLILLCFTDLSALLSSCICDLKCIHFTCWMILFLWSLYFRYSFHALNVFCIFYTICRCLDFVTISEQFEFQKFFAWFDDFVKRVDSWMTFCSILIILHTLSFIIVLLFKE